MRQQLTQQLTQLPSVRAGLVHVKCVCRKGLSGGLRLQLAHRHLLARSWDRQLGKALCDGCRGRGNPPRGAIVYM